MNKLNRRGFMTIEIILAAVLTFAVAFFLIDITMDLTDVTDNTYEDTVLFTDKSLIVKNLRTNIEDDMCSNGGIHSVYCNENTCTINMAANGVVRKIKIEGGELKYTSGTDALIYSKKLKESYSNVTLVSDMSTNGKYYNFKITGENIFIDENYNINVLIYNNLCAKLIIPIITQSIRMLL